MAQDDLSSGASPAAAMAPTLLSGRRFLVTGGARGLGAAVVEALSAAGATGAVVDLLPPEPGVASTWPSAQADLTDERGAREAIRALAEESGPFDGLVAAAGIVPSWHAPDQVDLEDFDRVMAVNVTGVVTTIAAVSPAMPPGSTIVAIGSLNSWRGDPHLLSYVASKHAVLGVVRSAAMALGPRGIRVNAIAPGPVATAALLSRVDGRTATTGLSRTEALAKAAELTALGRLAEEQDVADAAVFLSSPLSRAITGHLLPVDGGML
ncbi:SDR family oxidoreductase [Microbacterium sp. ABRD28]|uniref:SDR family NAD(P)-dependent oxidoreductase n=1 Tax=Microbacterium sp. ABRD28 TaxID=2268461 RepID=UPI000F554811|nr:SDR family oxidoreductase [Microbacterium sp. ABRD28]AZC14697.1 SDR family NAD(P)-dependent oxidoreductase [Microbacterium sp. ABRD28]